jgi:colanic acid biosynthesis glycosyl transferase WcaI
VLLLVNAHFAPDVAGSGQHLTDLAEHLSAAGMCVEVLTGSAAYEGGQLRAPSSEVRAVGQGHLRIRRVAVPGLGRRRTIGRIVGYVVFFVRALWVVCTRRGVDAVVVLTTPPLLPVVGWVGRAIRGRRYAVWSLDLHPEVEIAAGMLRSKGLVARALSWASDWAYRRADFVVDLGRYMRRRVLAKGVLDSRAVSIPVWAVATRGPSQVAVRSMRDRLRVTDKFVVMYAGNAGVVHDFGDLLVAMRRLRDHKRVFFLFVGGGRRRAELESGARDAGLQNFAYEDYVSRADLSTMLAVADAHVISLRSSFAGISTPGKVYDALATGRPVMFIGPSESEAADAVRQAPRGVVIDPVDGGASERIVETLQSWCDEDSGVPGSRPLQLVGGDNERGVDDRVARCRDFEKRVRREWPWVAA